VELEERAFASLITYVGLIVMLAASACAARRASNATADQAGREVQFEEARSDELVVLGLNS
jgi:hypothetical protein